MSSPPNMGDPLTSPASSRALPLDPADRELTKLRRINASLMQRVERSMDQQGNAYSLFQTAISLEGQVRARTEELKAALTRLEKINGEMMAARDAAERANRFKTRFFTAVGHDLLQPLHAARLSVSALSETDSNGADQALTRQIDHALTSIEEILRTILDLSKLEAGVIKPNMQAVGLDQLFASLMTGLGPLAVRKPLVLTRRHTGAAVMTDPLMLRRILQNLLANAVHYTESGSVKIAARRRGANVRIEIWDTGPGICAAEQKSIFEEFQRGSSSEAAGRSGFGLGLSIAQRMAETLGHPLGVCSKPGRGSMFHVSAPYAGEAPAIAEPVPSSASDADPYGFSGVDVLVIDNDPNVRDAMQTLLERWSCRMTFVSSMADIRALLANPTYQPRLVLADYHLDQGETGLEAVQRLRDAFGQELPAVVITADHTDEVTNLVSPHCDILRKPVRPAELRALMHHLLG